MASAAFRNSGLQLRTSKQTREDYKAMLLTQLHEAGFDPVQEYVFHEKRKWRFDLALVPEKVAVEYEGGVFDAVGGHSSISGILRDIEKYTEAALAGWLVIRTTAHTVQNGTALRYVKRAVNLRANCDTLSTDDTKLDGVRRTLIGLLKSIE